MGRITEAWRTLMGRAPKYAPPPPPAVPGTDMRVNAATLAELSFTGRPAANPWQLPEAPPFAPQGPDGQQRQMAMDSALVPGAAA